jgi:hypothetical protein
MYLRMRQWKLNTPLWRGAQSEHRYNCTCTLPYKLNYKVYVPSNEKMGAEYGTGTEGSGCDYEDVPHRHSSGSRQLNKTTKVISQVRRAPARILAMYL